MILHATFANRKHAPDEIEFVHAWDDVSVDGWPEGYANDREDALHKVVGSELLNHVTVLITLDETPIRQHLTGRLKIQGAVSKT